ncbi:MAG: hypothetical protein NTY76_04005 [Candidatus Omnitrophica bacterium]|nr:hypothetical protein [Candidatus Omnitrophota bacterium]
MKKLSTVFVTSIVALVLCNFAHAGESEDQDTGSSIMPLESIYSYNPNNAPEVFFFPKEKARWDGSRVTMREWYMLTEKQKEKFITEYLEEVRNKYKIDIDVMGVDYLKALNVFSAYSNDRILREPSTKFIDILLSGQGKVAEKNQPKNAGR